MYTMRQERHRRLAERLEIRDGMMIGMMIVGLEESEVEVGVENTSFEGRESNVVE